MLTELKQGGVQDVLVCRVDGLKGFPEAIEAVFPETWVQTCIVHLIRNSMRFVPYRDRRQVAKDLKPIYTAASGDEARDELERFEQTWGGRYPMISKTWRDAWQQVIPFLAFPTDVRRIVYTTDEKFKGAGHRLSRGSVACPVGVVDTAAKSRIWGFVLPRSLPAEGLASRAPLAAATPFFGALARRSATIWA